MASSNSKPTYEELLEQNKSLIGTVKALELTIGERDRKLKRKKRAWNRVKMIFKKDWKSRTDRYKQQVKELPITLKEEKDLQVTVEELSSSMDKVSGEVREKEEQTRKLAKRVAILQTGDRSTVVLKGKLIGADKPEGVELLAVAIFPEEIWKMILENLSDPKDLWNCTNTCQLFESILRPWKTGWMLEQALPYLYRHLFGQKLLECRQVSKGWNAGVDSFLNNHPSTRPHNAQADPRITSLVYPIKEKGIGNRNIFMFGPEDDLTRFEELFPQELDRNPFLGRTVTLVLYNPHKRFHNSDSPEVEKGRWAKLYSFLEAYGRHIWQVVIDFPKECPVELQQKFKKFLTIRLFQLAPNLRSLSYSRTCHDMSIDLASLVPAPKLDTFRISETNTYLLHKDELVYAHLKKYRGQLQSLQLTELAWRRVSRLGWPQLKELFLYLVDDVNDDDEDNDAIITLEAINFRSLTRTRVRMPLLSKLAVHSADSENFSFRSLLVAIRVLVSKTRLTTLQLGPGLDLQPEFNLTAPPELETLEFVPWDEENYGHSLPCHDFLRCFPYLKNLVMFVPLGSSGSSAYETDIELMPDEEVKRMAAQLHVREEFVDVNRYAYQGQMYKSNIWVLLPRLEMLTFQWDTYSREGFEAYSKSCLDQSE